MGYKIAVITANIGQIDPFLGFLKQNIEGVEYFCFTEHNLPVPLPNLDNRTKSKYLKTQMHRYLPGFDFYIWIDGRVKIESKDFVSTLVGSLDNLKYDISIYHHQERENSYQEIEYIQQKMKEGSGYLLSRYMYQEIHKELDYFKSVGLPKDYPLYHCNLFVRPNTNKINIFFDDWWRKCIEYSNFDQAMFSCLAWEHKILVNGLLFDPIRTYKLFKVEKHLAQQGVNFTISTEEDF